MYQKITGTQSRKIRNILFVLVVLLREGSGEGEKHGQLGRLLLRFRQGKKIIIGVKIRSLGVLEEGATETPFRVIFRGGEKGAHFIPPPLPFLQNERKRPRKKRRKITERFQCFFIYVSSKYPHRTDFLIRPDLAEFGTP